jgi:hypothetical protein
MPASEKSLSEKLEEPYRMMCPEHHHQLQKKVGPTVYCEQCAHAYRGEDLIDKKETQSGQVVPPG